MSFSKLFGYQNNLLNVHGRPLLRFRSSVCHKFITPVSMKSYEFSCNKSRRLFSASTLNMKSKTSDVNSLFIPVPVKPAINPDDINVGEELTGKLKKDGLLDVLNRFFKRPHLKQIAEENGLDNRLLHQAFNSFRRYCTESESLPVDLHVVCSDILQNAGHIDDLLPYFMRHARQIFPHLDCMEELKKISDLRLPANWYPEARAINRKIVFHAGPTNSGKTYHALERFILAKSGVYCGPLKMLATEVHGKTNARGTPCDLITGEERRYALPDRSAANHIACTVEMTSVTTQYEVAVIDEIQMMRDQGRGWAWTRALLGVAADEVHLCGEVAAIELVKGLCGQIGETVEVRKYKRLTNLTVQDEALDTLKNVHSGDCIVCFSKNDIYHVSRTIEKLGHEVAVIYGGLPPGTKLAQANKFNDPNDPCKILVATDAIGMGINLSIRRIIFYSLIKPTINEKGEKEMDTISTSQALQIAGRAGRYGTQFSEGLVTTLKQDDLAKLKKILADPIKEIEAAGLHPTAEQIELFAYHLPHATLSNLIDIFVSLCVVDDAQYFMCNVEDFKFLADMIQHVPLPLRARYVFCCSPINRKMPFVCTMFLKFTRQYSRNEPVTLDWLCQSINWPFNLPQNIVQLVHLEAVFDIFDLYLWLSYRFPDLFPDAELVRDLQKELDEIIQVGVANITRLLKASDTGSSMAKDGADEDSFIIKRKTDNYEKEKMYVPTRQEYPTVVSDADMIGCSSASEAEDPEYPEVDSQRYLKMVQSQKKDWKNKMPVGHGKLAEKLISQGLLTSKLLKELQKEWHDDSGATDSEGPKPKTPSSRRRSK